MPPGAVLCLGSTVQRAHAADRASDLSSAAMTATAKASRSREVEAEAHANPAGVGAPGGAAARATAWPLRNISTLAPCCRAYRPPAAAKRSFARPSMGRSGAAARHTFRFDKKSPFAVGHRLPLWIHALADVNAVPDKDPTPSSSDKAFRTHRRGTPRARCGDVFSWPHHRCGDRVQPESRGCAEGFTASYSSGRTGRRRAAVSGWPDDKIDVR